VLQILEPVPDVDFSVGNRVALLLLTKDARGLYARLPPSGLVSELLAEYCLGCRPHVSASALFQVLQ
jgi:hypothetical protein